jgi:hypothetical protein
MRRDKHELVFQHHAKHPLTTEKALFSQRRVRQQELRALLSTLSLLAMIQN